MRSVTQLPSVSLRRSVPATLAFIAVAMMSLFMTSCGGDEEERLQDLPANASSIEKSRAAKDRFFKSAVDSPLRKEDRPSFTGLSYFPYDEKFAVIAAYEAAETADTIRMPASQGTTMVMVRAGVFTFSIGESDKEYTLVAYKKPGSDARQLTIPFIDKTSGTSTYGAGRYLEVDEPTGEECTIDFNLAYNPYCAYNDDYSCLLIPASNILTVAINAGEKSFSLTHKASK